MVKRHLITDGEFIDQYAAFCQSPLRTKEEIRADLSRLCALPMVKTLAFADPENIYGTLMIGLRPLVITDPETNRQHFIGNFIVFITRYRNYPVWVTDFRLVNLNPQTIGNRTYYHPHMMVTTDLDLDLVADICISEGRFPIFQYIRRGQLDLAMELIINLLHTLGPDNPYYPINKWPLARFWRKKRWLALKKLVP